MNNNNTQKQTAFESVITPYSKPIINWCLETIAPEVVVVGSRITEDGWELLLEGECNQVSELIYALGEGVE